MSRKFAVYAGGLMACSALTTPAFAQDQDDAAAASALDENTIIVTATRRAQDVQDIPIAVTAVSQAQLDNQGVFNIQQISQLATSITASTAQVASGSVVLRIRGVGTTSNNIGFESAVGIFIDGVYQSRPGVALGEMVDIERVEVLRGPQGTLFGRNTSAGALNITTVRPDVSEFGGFVNAMYGNFDEISLQGAINVPIVKDTLALRLTGAYRKRDGFLDVVNAAGVRIGDTNDIDQFLVRGQIGWDTSGGIRGRIIADYSESRNSCCGAIELYQTPLVTAGIYGAVGLGLNGGNGQPSVATTPFDQGGFERALNNRVVAANSVPDARFRNLGISGEIEVPVGDNADLIAIGSWRRFDSREAYDSDFTARDLFNVGAELEIETFTAEVRFQGETFGGKLNYMIGGFYSDEKIDQSVNFMLGADFDRNVGALIAGATAGASLNPLSPIFQGPTPLQRLTGVAPAGTMSTNRFQQSAQSFALFTHNTFEITDGLEFTLGARYSWERKDGGFTQPFNNNRVCPGVLGGIGAGRVPAPLVPAFVGLGCFGFTAPANLPLAQPAGPFPLVRTFQTEFNDEELIYTANLNYAITPSINVYGSFTHGYKAGGINLDTTAAVGGANPVFQSEIVDAFELGFKSRFLNDAVTLNVAAFHMDFTNFQVLEFTGTAFETFNVPAAKSTGVEVEGLIRPNRELTINFGLTALRARYPENCAGNSRSVTVNSLCGFDLTNAPQVIAILGANWEKPLSQTTDFFINGQVRMEGDQRTSTQGIVPPDAAAIAAAGGNLQTAIDRQPLIIADIQDGKAFVNLRAGLRFMNGKYAIEGWVTNLTDEVVRGVTFNTTLRGSGAANSRSAFSLPPRQYGVTLRAQF
jgi:iron complex outermembrane receptor protein